MRKAKAEKVRTPGPYILLTPEMRDLIKKVVYSKGKYSSVSDFIRLAIFNQLLKEGVVKEEDKDRLL